VEQGRFTLTELAHQSQVTPRTIHFYIQQGLLKPAGSPGPGAKYDEGHLDRLRLIRHLQRQHLPLSEIRKRLDEMEDDAVRVAVTEVATATAAASKAASGRPDSSASALDHVRRLLHRDQSSASTRNRNAQAAQPASSPPLAPPSAAHCCLRTPSTGRTASMGTAAQSEPTAPATSTEPTEPPSAPRYAVSARSQWERHALAPDIELHVRRPLSRDQNRRIERLLALAHDIFEEELP